MTIPQETPNLSTKTTRDSIYEQKLSTQQQIMALCPFHMGISVDRQTTGPVKVFFLLLGCERGLYSSQGL